MCCAMATPVDEDPVCDGLAVHVHLSSAVKLCEGEIRLGASSLRLLANVRVCLKLRILRSRDVDIVLFATHFHKSVVAWC
jgi:hypothetical protein